ncbi:MAG: AI-2E family transporter [Candidatus Izimaplasma sp.]|nr:AI-2E family transporter [Candidatus Izimaplasma bacterium]
MDLNTRIKILHYLGMTALTIISLYYFNLLFSHQIQLLRGAITAIVLPFGIALFISYLLAPIIDIFEKQTHIKPRWLIVIIVLVLFLGVLSLFIYFIGDVIYEQAVIFFNNDFENIRSWVETTVLENETVQDIYDYGLTEVKDGIAPIMFNIINIFKSIVTVIAVIVLVPVFLFFLLQDKQKIFLGIVKTLPKKYQHHTEELGRRANGVIQKYFNGRFISILIMSVLFTIMFMSFGFSFRRSLFFGFVLGFLDIIPYIGAFIGIILPILYSFTIASQLYLGEYTFIGLLAANIALQAFQGNILQPYIMGKEVNLHPLLVLSSFVFFGVLFGVAGVILAIPITGIVRTSASYYKELQDKPENLKK